MSTLIALIEAGRELEQAEREVAELEPAFSAFFASDVAWDQASEQQQRRSPHRLGRSDPKRPAECWR